MLDNVKAALGQGMAALDRELVDTTRRRGHVPTLREFLADALLEPEDVYAKRDRGRTVLRWRAAVMAPDVVKVPAGGKDEERLARAILGLLHVDDPERLRVYRRLLFDPARRRSRRSRRASSGWLPCSTPRSGSAVPTGPPAWGRGSRRARGPRRIARAPPS